MAHKKEEVEKHIKSLQDNALKHVGKPGMNPYIWLRDNLDAHVAAYAADPSDTNAQQILAIKPVDPKV